MSNEQATEISEVFFFWCSEVIFTIANLNKSPLLTQNPGAAPWFKMHSPSDLHQKILGSAWGTVFEIFNMVAANEYSEENADFKFQSCYFLELKFPPRHYYLVNFCTSYYDLSLSLVPSVSSLCQELRGSFFQVPSKFVIGTDSKGSARQPVSWGLAPAWPCWNCAPIPSP